MVTDNLLKKYPIISDQIQKPALAVVLSHLEDILRHDMQGDIVEFGCYTGTTSLFIRRLLDAYGQSATRRFHVYDSFAGLPDKSRQDMSAAGTGFQAGALRSSKKELLEQFRRARLATPVIHKGWFEDLKPADVPARIAFAFLDGDFYSSILASLHLVWPRLEKGGIVTIDDCGREALPGVDHAIRDFFGHNQLSPFYQKHNIGVLHL